MLTVSQQQTGFKVAVSVLGMSLSNTYMQVYADYLNTGGNETSIYEAALNLPAGKTNYPTYLTSQQFFGKLVDNLVGLTVLESTKSTVVTSAVNMFNSGASKAVVVKTLVDALSNIPDNDATWGQAAMIFRNKLKITEYISLSTSTSYTDTELTNVLKNVTSITDVSNNTLIQQWINTQKVDTTSQNINLTTNTDALNGGSGNDMFVSENTSTVTTLNVFDNLDGGNGTDTFKIIDTSNNSFLLPSTMSLTNIENLILQHSANSAGGSINLNVSHLNSLRDIDIQAAGTITDTVIQTRQNVSAVNINNSANVTLDDLSSSDFLNMVTTKGVTGNITINSDAFRNLKSYDANMNLTVNTTGTQIDLEAVNTIQTWIVNTTSSGTLNLSLPGSSSATQNLTITGNDLSMISISGAGNLNTVFTGTKLSTFDASRVTSSLNWTSGALTKSSVIKTAAGGGTYDGSLMTMSSTWLCGDGNDVITVNNSSDNTIAGGNGNNVITTGSGIDTITVGSGNSRITSGSGLDVINLGTGNHTYVQTVNSNSNVYPTITGFNGGDKLDLLGLGATTFTIAKIALGANATYADYIAAAAAGTADKVTWFNFNYDTYVVMDKSAGSSFVNGTDQVVKLAGVVDLTTATIDAATAVISL